MELEERIINHFNTSMEVNAVTIEQYTPLIAHASELMLQTLVSENKILCCGNGGSASLAQHFSNPFCTAPPRSSYRNRAEPVGPSSLPSSVLDDPVAPANVHTNGQASG